MAIYEDREDFDIIHELPHSEIERKAFQLKKLRHKNQREKEIEELRNQFVLDIGGEA
jgi:Zn-dependent peptidase ImmA (M78 family)